MRLTSCKIIDDDGFGEELPATKESELMPSTWFLNDIHEEHAVTGNLQLCYAKDTLFGMTLFNAENVLIMQKQY